jgi:hypothetical protein
MMVGRRVVMRFERPSKQKPEDPNEAVWLEDKKWTLESIGSASVSKIGRTAFLVFDNAKGKCRW